MNKRNSNEGCKAHQQKCCVNQTAFYQAKEHHPTCPNAPDNQTIKWTLPEPSEGQTHWHIHGLGKVKASEHSIPDMAFTKYPCCVSFAQNGTQGDFIRATGHHPNCQNAPKKCGCTDKFEVCDICQNVTGNEMDVELPTAVGLFITKEEYLQKAELLLHLRFTNFKDVTIMEALKDSLQDPDLDDAIPHSTFIRGRTTQCDLGMDLIRTNLNEWANSLSDEKPLPRLEVIHGTPNTYILEVDATHTEYPEAHEIKALEQIIGHEIPIHTPQKYRSEWIEPKKFESDDLLESDGSEHTGYHGRVCECEIINAQLANLPQVWEFKLWRE